MKSIFFIVLLVFSNIVFAQRGWQPGYFIDNDGVSTEGLILNQDWRSNPTSFSFKRNEDAQVQHLNISEVSEFGIFDFSRYVRATVDYDMTPPFSQNPTTTMEPIWERGTLFLRVLVQGEATLYSYFHHRHLFFFSTSTTPIEQLVYKEYHALRRARVVTYEEYYKVNYAENLQFRQQLISNLQCFDDGFKRIGGIKYDERELVRLFIDYNKCLDSEMVSFSTLAELSRNKPRLRLLLGANSISPSVDPKATQQSPPNFPSKLNFTGGFEAEFFLPFGLNVWSVAAGLSFVSYDQVVANDRAIFKGLVFPASLRRSFYVSDEFRFTVDLGISLYFGGNESRVVLPPFQVFRLKNRMPFGVGAGLAYQNFSINFRMNELFNFSGSSVKLNHFSISAGYAIF